MNPITFRFGFRIVGACSEARRLVNWAAALAGYAACDPRAEVASEAYLSAFTFDVEFKDYLTSAGTTKDFSGPCWAPWVWFDIDRTNLDDAARDARRLASFIVDQYAIDDSALLLFFSGSKGFHIGLPTALWAPAPADNFHRVARRFAETLAERAGVTIDGGIYDRVRAFRAPNSRHPKTGLHKRRLAFDELLHLSVDAIGKRAAAPTPFHLPVIYERCEQAAAHWAEAELAVEWQTVALAERRAAAIESPKLNRGTLEFIRNGAAQGDRHRLLFSAAANLAEFGCPPALAHALLNEAALDSGLPPREVSRQIDCGLQTRCGGTTP